MGSYSDLIIAVRNNDIASQSSVENILLEISALVCQYGGVSTGRCQNTHFTLQNGVYNRKMIRYNEVPLFYLLFISQFVFNRRYIDKLGIFHADQTSICLDPHLK